MIELIKHTKLSNVAIAIRTCYNSFGNCKGIYSKPTDEVSKEDKELIEKVVKKFRHASTAEHSRFIFKTNEMDIINDFAKNKFTNVYHNPQYTYIQTNLRVLLENENLYLHIKDIIPNDFKFLF